MSSLLERARQLFVDTEELEVQASSLLLRDGRSAATKIVSEEDKVQRQYHSQRAQMNQHAAAASLQQQVEVQRTLGALLVDPALQQEVNECKGTDAGE
jgi:hypothetical protein